MKESSKQFNIASIFVFKAIFFFFFLFFFLFFISQKLYNLILLRQLLFLCQYKAQLHSSKTRFT